MKKRTSCVTKISIQAAQVERINFEKKKRKETVIGKEECIEFHVIRLLETLATGRKKDAKKIMGIR